jgi:hypothetical protein
MKKETRLLALLAILIASFSYQGASAQAELDKGNLLLNAGLGFGYYYAGGVSFNLNAEYSVTPELGIGGYFAYTHWENDWWDGTRRRDIGYNFIDIGARASYHFAKLFGVTNPKFDPYAGAFLGFVSSSYDDDFGYDDDDYDGGLRTGIHAGARYYFAPNFAGYGELGIGLSPLVLGVTLKL